MRVRVSDRKHLQDLVRYLRATECIAEQAGETEIEVFAPRAPNPEQARRQVEICLRAWQAMNPGATAELR